MSWFFIDKDSSPEEPVPWSPWDWILIFIGVFLIWAFPVIRYIQALNGGD